MAAMSEGMDEIITAIKQIIRNCTFGEIDVERIPQFDIEYIFLKLRCKSVGEIAEPIVECPQCKNNIRLKIDLNSVEVYKPKQSNNIKLATTDGIGIIFKYPTMEEETKLASMGSNVSSDYAFMYSCVDKIYDKDQLYIREKDFNFEEFTKFIDNLSGGQLDLILEFFAEQPRIEKQIEVKCPKCSHAYTTVLRGISNFLA
jgi:Zn finger protein HypA/HybF involved in hydrogenase expression